MKKFLSLLCAAAALFIAVPAAEANETLPAGGGASATATEGGGGGGSPPPPPPPQTPAPPAAKKEEEAPAPGFVKRVLAAAAGNKTIAATLNDKDGTIATLEAKVSSLEGKVAVQAAELKEAADWITGVANGTIDPVAKPPPNATAKAAAEAVVTSVSTAVRRSGIPVQDLQPSERVTRPAVTTLEAKSEPDHPERVARLDAIWKAAGYDRDALTAN